MAAALSNSIGGDHRSFSITSQFNSISLKCVSDKFPGKGDFLVRREGGRKRSIQNSESKSPLTRVWLHSQDQAAESPDSISSSLGKT